MRIFMVTYVGLVMQIIFKIYTLPFDQEICKSLV